MHGRHLQRVWKALSDPTRRQVIDLLSRRAQTTGELCGAFPRLSRFAVMKHLRVLERAGLVLPRKDGRQVWNHLNAVPLREVYQRWVGEHESMTAGSLLNLKRFVEEPVGAASEAGSGQIAHERSARVEVKLVLAADRERVFAALANDLPGWWARRRPNSLVTFEPRLGGRLTETWEGGGIVYGEVTMLAPPEALCIQGTLGIPGGGLAAAWFRLQNAAGRTGLSISVQAAGPASNEFTEHYLSWARSAAEGLQRFTRSIGPAGPS